MNNHSDEVREALLKTLSYADVFDYPMKFSELWKYFISQKRISRLKLLRFLNTEKWYGEKELDYYFLRDSNVFVSRREERLRASKKKMSEARKVAQALSNLPTIQCIGVSGSLSMHNSRAEEDIDFFIIARRNSVWLTRLLVFASLFVTGKLKRKDESETDKICPNMFLSSDALHLPQKDQNLFTAHEVVQLKVLINKDHIYEKFLLENAWISQYLANAVNASSLKKTHDKKEEGQGLFTLLADSVLRLLDYFLFFAQFWYMKRRIRCETVGYGIAKFHPRNGRKSILASYARRYRMYKQSFDEREKVLSKATKSILPEAYSYHGVARPLFTTGY